MDEDEEMRDFMSLPSEIILMRWLNWHLIRAQRPKLSLRNTAEVNEQKFGPLIAVQNYSSHLKVCWPHEVC